MKLDDIPFNTETRYDENLHALPVDPEETSRAVSWIEERIPGLDDRAAARAHGIAGSLCRHLGRFDDAERHLLSSIDRLHAVDDEEALFNARIRLANLRQWQGRFDEAESLFEELTCEAGHSPHLRDRIDFLYQHHGKCRFDQGFYAEAQILFERAMELRRVKGDEELIASTARALEECRRRMTGGAG
jgi:tetratricopeptide (TPR) repeat protein